VKAIRLLLRVSGWSACLSVAGCTGAGGHNTYSVARPAPPLRASGALIVENVWAAGARQGKRVSALAPAPVGFAVRLGVVDRLDAGVRFGWNLFPSRAIGVGTDLLAQVVESRTLDLAVNPRFTWTHLEPLTSVDEGGYRRTGAVGFGSVDLPFVAGLNVSESLSLLFIGGALYGFRDRDGEIESAFTEARFPVGFAPRMGIGLDSSAGGRVRFHPEITGVFSTAEGRRHVIITGGVAFQFLWYPERAPQRASR
jgi:hypothetical protein